MKKVLMLFLASFALLITHSALAKQATVHLNIKVCTNENGSPLRDVKLIVYKQTDLCNSVYIGTTNPDGTASLEIPAKGKYVVVANHCDFAKQELLIEPKHNLDGVLNLSVALQRLVKVSLPEYERFIHVIVRERMEDGTLVNKPGATVYTPEWWKDSDEHGMVAGKYYMPCGNTVTIWAEAKGYKTKGVTFTIEEGSDINSDVVEIILEKERVK